MDVEKYSLRQRQKRRFFQGQNTNSPGYNSDNSNESHHNSPLCKKAMADSNAKSKIKAAPLSKYRRKTANARERTRMREINSAFENLRHCVPACISDEDVGPSNEKLTKITTLRLAMKYIKVLSDALVDPHKPELDRLICDSIHYKPCSKTPNDSSVLRLQKTHDLKLKPAKIDAPPTKRHGKQGKAAQSRIHESSPIPGLLDASPASNTSSAYASLSPSSDSSASPLSNYSYRSENNTSHSRQSTSDISNFMLESDGDSIHLSERWSSPLHTQLNVSSLSNDIFECSPSDMPTLENPLELSLRLMEPPIDSLAISPSRVHNSHSTCLTSLMSLETFTSFDLFHSDDFDNQSALDLFLT
ncbi:helix-loop-helix protein delilah [Musca vetustissima]|uniref:helix-loop-helix protein delilah n=1 Tax=Musca vetustissima TaxID=27455 RepID=UPI002AB79E17|nr:helix-loop-helix protein delilah [Musca vetustissima]